MGCGPESRILGTFTSGTAMFVQLMFDNNSTAHEFTKQRKNPPELPVVITRQASYNYKRGVFSNLFTGVRGFIHISLASRIEAVEAELAGMRSAYAKVRSARCFALAVACISSPAYRKWSSKWCLTRKPRLPRSPSVACKKRWNPQRKNTSSLPRRWKVSLIL